MKERRTKHKGSTYIRQNNVLKNNSKGQWITEEAKAQFNNTVINADDYPELLSNFEDIVYAGDENFPRCTFGKIEEYETPIDI